MNSNRVPFPWNPADYRPRIMLIQPVAGERNIGTNTAMFPVRWFSVMPRRARVMTERLCRSPGHFS
jgi:hypothetical protein